MWHHVYPHWHKAAQRCFSFIAVVLLITLPVVYGKHHSISSKVLGSVLGVFFAIWIAFSLIVRFLVPSPVVESTLPIYTHSPIPDPVVLYSPTRSNATPAAPAIRLHPSSAATPRAPGRTGGARFADDPVDVDAAAAGTGGAIRNNVTFQTRPRGNTADSTSSFAYPTFAAYRQAQHVNFDAFAQRVKRAFALSQQQQQEQQRELEEQELQKQQLALQQLDEELDELKQQQQQHPLSLDQQRPTNSRSNSTSAVPSSTLATNAPATGTRSRSSSAASMMSEFAERLKTGKLFRRTSNLSLRATAVANAAASEAAGVSSSTLSKRPSNQQLKDSNNTAGDAELLSSPLGPLGIEITVTPSEDDHPSTGTAHTPTTTANATTTAKTTATATATTGSAPAIPASAASSL
ncbi:hypothetical protein EC957_008509 [Mortierella hygrophila]|uniref:Uncharacterized protein n=1 Tax=Mortierella hygrophila TaxID=979708 RepID=A0A9P6JXK3_9FUNG|nr:hypothetical protein EC957_008509 [Mortierella hygrophila]